ncbi:MAG TPA: PilZ domain-containing protein [Pyrinomonadaceae bacterium]|nr:PilZ domain-containing protein [Pyrinomonadaceae bacterium]
MIRSLITKITGLIAERSHAPRKTYAAPVKISFERVNIRGIHTSTADGVFMSGETMDMSKTGISFMVSAIRIKENYLVGHERILNIEIDLPRDKVKMQVIGRRYEREGIHESAERYLVGAEIVNISEEDREAYEHFLRHGATRRRAAAPSLEMGGN